MSWRSPKSASAARPTRSHSAAARRTRSPVSRVSGLLVEPRAKRGPSRQERLVSHLVRCAVLSRARDHEPCLDERVEGRVAHPMRGRAVFPERVALLAPRAGPLERDERQEQPPRLSSLTWPAGARALRRRGRERPLHPSERVEIGDADRRRRRSRRAYSSPSANSSSGSDPASVPSGVDDAPGPSRRPISRSTSAGSIVTPRRPAGSTIARRSPSATIGRSRTRALRACPCNSPMSSRRPRKSLRSVTTTRTRPDKKCERGHDGEERLALGRGRECPDLLELVDHEQKARPGSAQLAREPSGRRLELRERVPLAHAEERRHGSRERLGGLPSRHDDGRLPLGPRAERSPLDARHDPRTNERRLARPRRPRDEDERIGAKLGDHGRGLGLATEEERAVLGPERTQAAVRVLARVVERIGEHGGASRR